MKAWVDLGHYFREINLNLKKKKNQREQIEYFKIFKRTLYIFKMPSRQVSPLAASMPARRLVKYLHYVYAPKSFCPSVFGRLNL